MNKFLLLLLLTLSTAIHAGDTRYITDQLEVTLRSGQSTKHQIIRMLPSGTAIEIIKESKDGQYTRIRTAKGKKGWVLSHYLEEQPSARQRLQTADQQLTRIRNENKRLKKDLKAFRSDKRSLSKQKDSLTSHSKGLQQELNRIKRVSADVLGVDQKNRGLNSQLQILQSNYDQAQQQISSLQDSTARDWFIVGSGVILLGILLGLIIPKIRWKRKSEWGSL